jgi:hypothetical protein
LPHRVQRKRDLRALTQSFSVAWSVGQPLVHVSWRDWRCLGRAGGPASTSTACAHAHHRQPAPGPRPLRPSVHQFRADRRGLCAVLAFLGALGAWDNAMVASWSTKPLAMLWPEMDAAFMTSGGGGRPAPAGRRGGRWFSSLHGRADRVWGIPAPRASAAQRFAV